MAISTEKSRTAFLITVLTARKIGKYLKATKVCFYARTHLRAQAHELLSIIYGLYMHMYGAILRHSARAAPTAAVMSLILSFMTLLLLHISSELWQ